MNFKAAINALFERKETAAGRVISLAGGSRDAVWAPRDYEHMAKEAYQKNIIAYRAINLFAQAAASVPWGVREGDSVMDEHPMLALIKRPNPMQARAEYFEAIITLYLLTGNAYLEGVSPTTGPPLELWTHRPDRMKIKPGPSNVPARFVYSASGNEIYWEVDPQTGESAILHLKTFNPVDDWYGQSPLEAAGMSIDIHNDALRWNKVLLQSDARPPGVMSYNPKDGNDTLEEGQRARIVEELDRRYSGRDSNKRPLLLEGGLEWQQLGLSPKDMDFIEAQHVTATDIAQAIGVPPQLVGIPGSQTFANYEEARLAFWEDSVIPLLYNVRDEINNWLPPKFESEGEYYCDLDKVPALGARRKAHFDMIQASTTMTINEKREAQGLDPVGSDGDVILVSATMLPLGFAVDDPEKEAEKELGGSIEYKLFITPDGANRQREVAIQLRLTSAFERRISPRIAKTIDSAAKAAASAVEYGRSPDKALAGHSVDIAKALGPHYLAVMRAFGKRVLEAGKDMGALETKDAESEFNARIASWIQKWGAEKAKGIGDTTKLQIKTAIIKGEEAGEALPAIAKRIRETVGGQMSKVRSAVIARTETHGASVAAGDEALGAMGLDDLKREWIAVEDDFTRPTHLEVNGTKRKKGQPFKVGSSSLDHPGDPSGEAQEIINCRCILAAVVEG
jgi:HK97 family phage portal protein